MEDPWAAGPSWSNPARLPGEEERETIPALPAPPPDDNAESDPWVVTTTQISPSHNLDAAATLGPISPSEPYVSYAETPSWGAEPSPEITSRELDPQISPSSGEADTLSDEGLQPPGLSALVLNSPIQSLDSLPQEHTTPLPNPIFDTPVNPDSIAGPTTPIQRHLPLERDEEDPEASFLSALQVSTPKPTFNSSHSPAKSPVFSDGGFGGFSSHLDGSDPWGGDGEDVAAGGSMPMAGTLGDSSWGDSGNNASPRFDNDEDTGQDDWGSGSRLPPLPGGTGGQTEDDEWEEAQRIMRLRAERAPHETVQQLKNEWAEVAKAFIGSNEIEKLNSDQQDGLEKGVASMQADTREALRSLGSIPTDISTYPPVISSLETHERHSYALARPNSVPSTSLLTVSLNRQPRRVESMASSSPWLSRSRLGEPDAPSLEAPSMSAEEGKARWSFWGRKAASKPLVTSGGSVLEVKASPAPGETLRASGSGEMNRSSSRTPSISISAQSSRPASPAPGPFASSNAMMASSSQTSLPPSTSVDSVGHPAQGGQLGQSTPQGPSAVSRFFGRLSRRQASNPTVNDLDGTDLQLSNDDFAFLSEVPSMSDPSDGFDLSVGDLLSMETGQSDHVQGLESMLASKPAVIPPPIAPPPPAPFTRTPSGPIPSGRFVAKMKAPPATDLDLLGGLDFASDTATPPANTASQTTLGSTSMWDDFLGPPTAGKLRPPTLPNPPPTLSSPPTIVPSPKVPSSSHLAPASSSEAFDDFASPQKASMSTSFDDFGDFSAFEDSVTASTHPSTASPSRNVKNHSNLTLTPQAASSHRKTPSVDHSSTMSLMSEATALKGRRWPAPPSPAAPNLEPPPRASGPSGSDGFPFLSPPPPPRPASGASRSQNLLDSDDMTPSLNLTPPPTTLPPPRGSTLTPPVSSGLKPAMFNGLQQPELKTTPRLSAGANLTASDLSFFDSL